MFDLNELQAIRQVIAKRELTNGYYHVVTKEHGTWRVTIKYGWITKRRKATHGRVSRTPTTELSRPSRATLGR